MFKNWYWGCFCVFTAWHALGLAETAQAEIVYRETTNHFELGENLHSKTAIWQAIRRTGPQVGGKHAIGTASGKIGYRFRWRQSDGICSVTEAQFNVGVKIRLPEWQYYYQAPQDARDFFGCVLNTVTVHEKRHAEIWHETAQEMEEAFLSELQNVPCGEMKRRARGIYDEIYARSRERQADFDRTDQNAGRYSKCARGEADWGSSRDMPQISGRLPWSEDVSFEQSRGRDVDRRRDRRQAERSEEAVRQREMPAAVARPLAKSAIIRASDSRTRTGVPAPAEGGSLFPIMVMVGGLLGIGGAIWLFFTIAMSGSFGGGKEAALDDMPAEREDWTKRALSAVKDRSAAKS